MNGNKKAVIIYNRLVVIVIWSKYCFLKMNNNFNFGALQKSGFSGLKGTSNIPESLIVPSDSPKGFLATQAYVPKS